MLLRMGILLNQCMEIIGIAILDDTDDLIPGNLMITRGK
jgi:hypothetical protein